MAQTMLGDYRPLTDRSHLVTMMVTEWLRLAVSEAMLCSGRLPIRPAARSCASFGTAGLQWVRLRRIFERAARRYQSISGYCDRRVWSLLRNVARQASAA